MSNVHGFLASPKGSMGTLRNALVVDTDRSAAHSMALALRQAGLEVFEATSFREGKLIWSTQSPDVLIVDIRLGEFNGLQLLMRARSDRPDLRAIITCPFADPVLEAETHRFGGIFMLKPVNPLHVVEAVRGLVVAGSVPAPVTPPFLLERRRTDRRGQTSPISFQDRRTTERRNLVPEPTIDRRQPEAASVRRGVDRRQTLTPGYIPERRVGDRRSMRA